MSGPDLAMLETYFRMMNTNGAAQVYHAALAAGVLAALEDRSIGADELADACGLRTRPVELMLEALAAMKLVRKQGESYGLTAVTRMLLGSEYRELGNQYWRHLPEFLRSGVPLKKMDDVAQSEEHYQSQAAILGWMLSPAAQAAADILHERLSGRALAILDVGAGSAVWSLSLARRHERSHVTAVDWPAVLEVAKESANERGMSDRLTTVAGDAHAAPLPESTYDVAMVANLTHLQTPSQNEALFRKIHMALKPAGTLVIIDAFAGSPAGDVPFALYKIGLALRTEHGRVYSPSELQSMLGSGFELGELIPLDTPPYVVGMLVCDKRDVNLE